MAYHAPEDEGLRFIVHPISGVLSELFAITREACYTSGQALATDSGVGDAVTPRMARGELPPSTRRQQACISHKSLIELLESDAGAMSNLQMASRDGCRSRPCNHLSSCTELNPFVFGLKISHTVSSRDDGAFYTWGGAATKTTS